MAHYNVANMNKVQMCRLLTEFVETVMCPGVSDENTSVSYVTAVAESFAVVHMIVQFCSNSFLFIGKGVFRMPIFQI